MFDLKILKKYTATLVLTRKKIDVFVKGLSDRMPVRQLFYTGSKSDKNLFNPPSPL